MTTEAPAMPAYRLIEKPSRIYAIDLDDVEICGARQPYGSDTWVIYPTARLTDDPHQVIAASRSAALKHVVMLAELFIRGQR